MPIENLVQGRLTETLNAATDGYFEISALKFGVPFPPFEDAIRLSGRFLADTETAYDAIARRMRPQGFLVYFRDEEGEPVIYAAMGELPVTKPNWPLFGILLAVTLVSIFFVGGLSESGINWGMGLSLAIPLILILLAHEFGHFLVSKHYGMATSPPYFIPMPLSIFGTMGAVIIMRAPPKNRKQLFQMAVAGPLAGLALAVPFMIYGLSVSTVGPLPPPPYVLEGNSIFYLAMKWLFFHQILPGQGLDVQLHNIAFAAWIGFFITGLNLIPTGQLDGGHVIYTLFGKRIRSLNYLVVSIFLLLSIKFPGWLLWAALLFLLGRTYAAPMDDLTPLDGKHRALGYFMLLLLVLFFAPNPITMVQ